MYCAQIWHETKKISGEICTPLVVTGLWVPLQTLKFPFPPGTPYQNLIKTVIGVVSMQGN